ncbi:MAG TPA: peptide-methionine (R)-S-oxide reductase, partial [Longimicrobiales bacterium]
MNRKTFLKALAAGALGAPVLNSALRAQQEQQQAANAITPLKKSDKEWRKLLTRQQYAVLREEDTEYPGTSPLLKEHRKGTFICAGCFLPLFEAAKKFESGTGWPSFYDVMPGRVARKTDFKIGYPRSEYHCARCG